MRPITRIWVHFLILNFDKTLTFIAAKNQHDMLAAFAKEEGKSLHRDLPSEERRSAIEQKVKFFLIFENLEKTQISDKHSRY